MVEGFTSARVELSGSAMNKRRGGHAPPLPLRGEAQTHVMCHKVAPVLAERFTVIPPELRGDSGGSTPRAGAGHYGYARRAKASAQIEPTRAPGVAGGGQRLATASCCWHFHVKRGGLTQRQIGEECGVFHGRSVRNRTYGGKPAVLPAVLSSWPGVATSSTPRHAQDGDARRKAGPDDGGARCSPPRCATSFPRQLCAR
jgi:hypothetical protein